ncbi:MAG: menaquinone biosynthesis protein [Bacteroidales bacterium]|nr:menaquinone biosynthesis protein [Bacteroidales bacterium]
MDNKIKIVLVSYFNSLPFLYGLENSDFIKEHCEIILKYPSEGAKMLQEKKCDIALVPVGIIPSLKISYIVSKYCIGAEGKVRSVILASQVPLDKIERVYLDYQSATSVRLVRILAKYHWKIRPEFVDAKPGYESKILGNTAGVIIGDRCFEYTNFKYQYDLAEEWQNFSGLPFVFAAWLAVRPVNPEVKKALNDALEFGVSHIEDVIQCYKSKFHPNFNAVEYFTKNISYYLNEQKSKGMNSFIKHVTVENRAESDFIKRQLFASK